MMKRGRVENVQTQQEIAAMAFYAIKTRDSDYLHTENQVCVTAGRTFFGGGNYCKWRLRGVGCR